MNVEIVPATQKRGSFSMQMCGPAGISTIREARHLGQLSLSYGIGVMGKGGVSVGVVVCFHRLGFQDWLYQEFNLTRFLGFRGDVRGFRMAMRAV